MDNLDIDYWYKLTSSLPFIPICLLLYLTILKLWIFSLKQSVIALRYLYVNNQTA